MTILPSGILDGIFSSIYYMIGHLISFFSKQGFMSSSYIAYQSTTLPDQGNLFRIFSNKNVDLGNPLGNLINQESKSKKSPCKFSIQRR